MRFEWRQFLDENPRPNRPKGPNVPVAAPLLAHLAHLAQGSNLNNAAAKTRSDTGVTLVSSATVAKPVASCAGCRYRTTFGNCATPIEAGIAAVFKLVAHPNDGRDCAVYRSKVFVHADTDALISEIAQRLQFSTADVDEMRQFAARHPSYAYREFTAWKDRLWKDL